jgi:hypothetical protein
MAHKEHHAIYWPVASLVLVKATGFFLAVYFLDSFAKAEANSKIPS